MSLYPSLEDMKVDGIVRAQIAQTHGAQPYQSSYSSGTAAPNVQMPHNQVPQPYPSSYPRVAAAPSAPHVYLAIDDYIGLELSTDVMALNMPGYLAQTTRQGTQGCNLVAPISSKSVSLPKAIVTQAIRQIIVCKDKDGKCGLRLHSMNNGIFVCYVAAGSPAAIAGLRFGDQILEINSVTLAGMSREDCYSFLKKASVSAIVMAVRDRPFERTVTLHKDSLGHVGFQFKDGNIVGLVKDSSAARNGLLTDHQLLEVNTINVVGMKDKDISKVIEASPAVLNITIIPQYLYKHMTSKITIIPQYIYKHVISKISNALFKDLDRTPAV